MNILNQKALFGKITILLPVFILLFTVILIKLSNIKPKTKNKRSKDKIKENDEINKYINKFCFMIFSLFIPFIIDFILSFIIKNTELYNYIYFISWILFFVMLISGIFIINRKTKR